MEEKKINWTKQQALAVSAKGSDILVTASAGTGKTAVLSGRCVFFITDAEQAIADMLLLTFTDAAAEQMQKRIRRQLRDKMIDASDITRINTAISHLPAADISTIHSFCKKLITEYFYKLDIDPTFRVIDADEQLLLKYQALEKTVEWAWTQENLQTPLENIFRARDLRIDGAFTTKIIDLSEFVNSCLGRAPRYEKAANLVEALDHSQTAPGIKQKQIIAEKLKYISQRLLTAQKLYQTQNASKAWPADWQQSFAQLLEECISLMANQKWQQAFEKIRSFEKPARITKPRDVEETIAEVIRQTIKDAVDKFTSLNELASINPDYLDRIAPAVKMQTRLIIELLKKFDSFYSQAKLSANCMDFADLEHYALKLLCEPDSTQDKIIPTQTALSLRRKYKFIFVDEYQDINPVQEAILKALSTGDNIFVVGDIKQSIYAFRGAEPSIFLGRLTQASSTEKTQNALRVDLNTNFRSSQRVLDFVNAVFDKIMKKEIAGIDYDTFAMLKSAGLKEQTDSVGPLVELHIIDKNSPSADQDNSEENDEDSISADSRSCQATLIAQKIKKMVGAETGKAEFKIYDNLIDSMRDIEYRDIVVLMRSPANRIDDYVRIFRLAGIPVSSRGTGGYFEATEITDILNLLKILDNSQRDIELAAVLRSPLFDVTDTELAKIKIHARENESAKSFYDCLRLYSDTGPDKKLAKKIKTILERITEWRSLAQLSNIADLIWMVYRQTSLLSFVSALPSGPVRKANLLKLHDRAIQFDSFASGQNSTSLSRFVFFLEKLQQRGAEWSFAEPGDTAENAVQITSIHKSKGLEFPVVILAETDNKFNITDSSGDLLADVNLGIGLQVIDHTSNTKVPSLAHQTIAETRRKTSLAEEMRILYVALTRAKARLILTGCQTKKHCRQIILDSHFAGKAPNPRSLLENSKSFLDWLLFSLTDNKSLHNCFETGFESQAGDNNLFEFSFYDEQKRTDFSKYIDSLKQNKFTAPKKPGKTKSPLSPQQLNQLKKSLLWKYPFASVAHLPAKRSVTQITHSNDLFTVFERSSALERKPKVIESAIASGIPDSRIIGSAYHLAISSLDLSAPVNDQTVQTAIDKLICEAKLIPETAQHIDVSSIVGFFTSPLGQKIFEPANQVLREWPFTFAIPAEEAVESENAKNPSDELIVVQGIIDLIIQTESGLIIVDFKTDNITASQCAERSQLYKKQITLYARAARQILESPLLSGSLYFLKCAKLVQIC